MEFRNFLSTGCYVTLPTKSKPKVYLPIDNSKTAERAFKLYNPFSKKAKFLKSIIKFLTVKLNPLAKILLPTTIGQNSSFIVHLEKILKKKLTTSVYVATEKDKLVLQIQDSNQIFGYLKYPISEVGKKRLTNEAKAIAILSSKNIVPSLILHATYKEVPFFILQDLKGSIGQLTKQEYSVVLNKLKKEKSFVLKEHPRVIGLQKRLEKHKYQMPKINLDKILALSNEKYLEVFEHGDFAPWNLIKTSAGVIPFDFEYFEEEGLEYLDEIKYHFQEQHLLKHKTGNQLIQSISVQIAIEEFDIFFQIFLIKEILNKTESKDSYELELYLLNLMNQGYSEGIIKQDETPKSS